MVLDEAPAATTGGFNGKGDVDRGNRPGLKLPGHFRRNGPTSLVAAEIHLGCKPAASATAGCTATFKSRAIQALKKYQASSNAYRNFLEPRRTCGH
jgi:hypothetical protein